jgi:hypothetical protein
MKTCNYCGRENLDEAGFCGGCGTSLMPGESEEIQFPTPHRAKAEILQFIWEYFAVKRGRIYLAAVLICVFGCLIGILHDPTHLEHWCAASVAVCASGIGAVWFLSFSNRLQARIQQDRAEGNLTIGTQIFFVLLGLAVLVGIAALVAIACALVV